MPQRRLHRRILVCLLVALASPLVAPQAAAQPAAAFERAFQRATAETGRLQFEQADRILAHGQARLVRGRNVAPPRYQGFFRRTERQSAWRGRFTARARKAGPQPLYYLDIDYLNQQDRDARLRFAGSTTLKQPIGRDAEAGGFVGLGGGSAPAVGAEGSIRSLALNFGAYASRRIAGRLVAQTFVDGSSQNHSGDLGLGSASFEGQHGGTALRVGGAIRGGYDFSGVTVEPGLSVSRRATMGGVSPFASLGFGGATGDGLGRLYAATTQIQMAPRIVHHPGGAETQAVMLSPRAACDLIDAAPDPVCRLNIDLGWEAQFDEGRGRIAAGLAIERTPVAAREGVKLELRRVF